MRSYLSAYELAVKNGFVGTQEDFVNAILRGEHNAMSGRAKEDAHPISSITGLAEKLQKLDEGQAQFLVDGSCPWTQLELVPVALDTVQDIAVNTQADVYRVFALPRVFEGEGLFELEVIVFGLGSEALASASAPSGVLGFKFLPDTTPAGLANGEFCVVDHMQKSDAAAHMTRHHIFLQGSVAHLEISGIENDAFIHRYEERTPVYGLPGATRLQLRVKSNTLPWKTHGVIFRYREVLSHA